MVEVVFTLWLWIKGQRIGYCNFDTVDGDFNLYKLDFMHLNASQMNLNYFIKWKLLLTHKSVKCPLGHECQIKNIPEDDYKNNKNK